MGAIAKTGNSGTEGVGVGIGVDVEVGVEVGFGVEMVIGVSVVTIGFSGVEVETALPDGYCLRVAPVTLYVKSNSRFGMSNEHRRQWVVIIEYCGIMSHHY